MPEIQMIARAEVDFRTPEGTRLWMTTLMADSETGEARHRLNGEARGDSEEQSRQLLALALERLAVASGAENGHPLQGGD